MSTMIKTLIFSFIIALNYTANANDNKLLLAGDPFEIMHNECINNKKFLAVDYNIQCEKNYQHYNSSAARNNYSKRNALSKKIVKISEFNLLHPGTGKSRFKDYKKIALILNQYDVIAVTELIPLMSDDAMNNNAILNFIDDSPMMIESTKKKIAKLQKSSLSANQKIELKLLKLKLEQLKKDLINVSKIYRFPGYLKVLNELHKLTDGDEWALVLAPKAEGALKTPTPELIGYYYRSSAVKLDKNPYCNKVQQKLKRQGSPLAGRAAPAACIVNMDKNDFNEDKKHVFSRRPFLAQFRSGNFKFTLLTAHIIFGSPSDNTELSERILQSAFDVSTYNVLGRGLTKKNYARFAEVKVTLDFIKSQLIEKYGLKDIIYMGDFNLTHDNKFWKTVLKSWQQAQVFISDKTSVTTSRYEGANRNETFGRSKNYDHFIFDPVQTNECIKKNGALNGGVYDFMRGRMGVLIDKETKIRKSSKISRGKYPKSIKKYNKNLKTHVTDYTSLKKKILTVSSKKYVYSGKNKISTTGIVTDELTTKNFGIKYKSRVMDSQLKDRTYYGYYKETISDHFPVYMKCLNQ